MIKRIVILLLMFIFLTAMGFLIKKWRAKPKSEKIEPEQIQPKALYILKEKMDDAIYALKTAELSLYALPWFLVIGPTAAGKSTLIRHSDLHFSLVHEGCGGTKNCDWWFADEAIFLDTAGRYITEDNKEEWEGFLKLLKKHRPRKPVSGILVVWDIFDILSLDDEALKKRIKLIRERISEITKELGFLFPVYLILTKLDLLPGFNSYFKNLSETEQKQVMGVYLNSEDKINIFKDQLKLIYIKLLSLVFKYNHFESNHFNQIEIIDFPRQFEKIEEYLIYFIKLLFKENPYQETPNFMGVYFTGVSSGRYFIHDIFSKVIFSNQGDIAKSKHKLLSLRWIKIAGIMAALCIIITTFISYSISFSSNHLFLNHAISITEDTNNALIESSLTYSEKLQSLKTLSDFIAPLDQKNKIYIILSKYLKQNLDRYFLKPVAESLEKELSLYQEKWALNSDSQNQLIRGDYYTTLKVYLMLCEPEHMDTDLAAPILSETWSRQTKFPENLLRRMVYFYLTTANHLAWGEKSDLVQLSRQQLYSETHINNLYEGFKAKELNQYGKLSIQQFMPSNYKNYFVDNILLPAFFTKNIYENHVKSELEKTANDAARGDWVMGSFQNKLSSIQIIQLRNQLTKLYFDDYIKNWLIFLNNIHYQTFEDIEGAIKLLSDEPLTQLLTNIDQNFDIENSSIKNYFHDFVNIPEVLKSDYSKKILNIKNLFIRLSASSDMGKDTEVLSTQILSGSNQENELYQASLSENNLANNINNHEVKNALSNILLSPIRESWSLILRLATKNIQTQWESIVINNYQELLSNKFPFAKNGDDADRESVSHFFNKDNGILWQFIAQNLTAYLQQTPKGWEARRWLDVGVNFSPQFLIALNQAKLISDNLFPEFEFYPIPTPGLREITLSINNQNYHYRNEPQEWQKIRWQNDENNNVASLSIITANDDSIGTIQFEGLWGLFKLLKQATLSDEKESIRATWNIKSDNNQHYKVSIIFKGKILILDNFVLPTNLFDNKEK